MATLTEMIAFVATGVFAAITSGAWLGKPSLTAPAGCAVKTKPIAQPTRMSFASNAQLTTACVHIVGRTSPATLIAMTSRYRPDEAMKRTVLLPTLEMPSQGED